MKKVLADIFTRSVALLSSDHYACLRVKNVSAVEDNPTLKAPIGTALIVGIDGPKKEPLAILGVISPHQRDLRKRLHDAYYRRTLDVAVAERLTQATFDRLKLPKILSG